MITDNQAARALAISRLMEAHRLIREVEKQANAGEIPMFPCVHDLRDAEIHVTNAFDNLLPMEKEVG